MTNQSHELILLGAACCVGAQDKRCELGPDRLRELRIDQYLTERGIPNSWQDMIRPDHPDANPLEVIEDLCQKLATNLRNIVQRQNRFIVFGGDHSCAIGTWSGVASTLKDSENLGLIWVDAHMDSHLPETSPSGAIHGMPLACLLGHGDQKLRNIINTRQKLLPKNVCLIGVRSYEHEEEALLKLLGVKVITMETVRQHGLNSVWAEAVDYVSKQTTHFGVTIDLDAIDPSEAPGVGSPEARGIKGKELEAVMQALSSNTKFVGAEIAEYNPTRDKSDKTAKLAMRLVASMFARGYE